MPQRGPIGDPLNLMCFKEAIAPPLSFMLFSNKLQLLKKGQLLLSFLLKALLTQLIYLRATYFEDLAEILASLERYVVGRAHQLAIPESNDIIDLLF